MSRLLLVSSATLLIENSFGQDTGGPFKGTMAINKETSGSCTDNRGQSIPEGMLFEPGPDECQVCTCLRQLPVLCRTVLCAPPQGCRSLRVGDACCEWVCDQWEDTGHGSVSDLGLRLVASAVTAILSLSLLFFLIYRLRQRKLRGRQNHLEAESYNSMGGRQDDSIEDIPGQTFNLGSLKPHDRAMMRRPFPPTYNEAMYGHQISSAGPLASEQAASNSLDLSSDQEAPPYSSIHQDPVISYPVATLGRLVLPGPHLHCGTLNPTHQLAGPGATTCNTLPSMIRRVMREHETRPSLPGTVDEAEPDLQPYSLQLNMNPSSTSNSSSYGSHRINYNLSPPSLSPSDSEPELTQTAV